MSACASPRPDPNSTSSPYLSRTSSRRGRHETVSGGPGWASIVEQSTRATIPWSNARSGFATGICRQVSSTSRRFVDPLIRSHSVSRGRRSVAVARRHDAVLGCHTCRRRVVALARVTPARTQSHDLLDSLGRRARDVLGTDRLGPLVGATGCVGGRISLVVGRGRSSLFGLRVGTGLGLPRATHGWIDAVVAS